MLRVYFGNNAVEARKTAFDFADTELESGKTLETIDVDNYEPGIFADAAGGASLFGGEVLYVIDTPSLKSEMYEDVLNNLEHFATSLHIFVVIEGPLLAPERKKFEKYAESLEEFKAGAAERFNTFALADALARKDKKSLWLLYSEARMSGIPLEEIAGVLWWQLKTLRLASLTRSASEAGVKDFSYNKAKRALGKFAGGELEKLSHSLLSLQHESRLGRCELDIALERFVLGL